MLELTVATIREMIPLLRSEDAKFKTEYVSIVGGEEMLTIRKGPNGWPVLVPNRENN